MAKLLSGTRIYGTATVDTTLFVDGTDDASSATTGAVQVVGGVGIGGTLYVEGTTVFAGDLAVNGGNLTTTATTFNLINANATTVNFAGAATTLEIGAATGTTNINNNLDVDGDVNIDGGDLTVSTVTFNLANTTATAVNFAGAATSIEIGSAIGVTNINNNLDVDGDVNIDGGDLTVSTATFNLANAVATTVNAFGAGTAITIGDVTGTTTIRNANTVVTGDLAINGGDITSSAVTFNILPTTSTTVNAFGAASALNLGATAGITIVRNNFEVDLNTTLHGTLTVDLDTIITSDLAVNGGDLTTSSTTFNLINANATTVNFAGAATTLEIGAATGTTNINNNLDVDGDVNIDGGDLTVSTSTFNLANTTATTGNLFGAATTVNIGAAGSAGILTVRNDNVVLNGDLAVNGGDLTTTATTFNLITANATTVNAFTAATTLEIGAATGTTNINHDLDVDGNVNIDGGDLTVSAATFNLANANATTVNAFGAATTILIGAGTGTTEVNNNLQVDLDLDVRGGDITTNQTTFNLINTTATTGNLFGDGTAITIGATTGTTTIRNANTVVTGDLAVNGADITTSATGTATVFNTNATTVNFAGAATSIEIGAATGTTNINNDLDVDGDVNIDGGDLTVSTTTFNLANTTATTGNLFGVATGVNVGINAAAASTLTFGPAITGNIVKIRSTTGGTVDLNSDVTSGIVGLFDNNSGTTNLANAGTINLGNSSSNTTLVDIGGAITGNQLKISGTSSGTVTVTSDVTTGTVNLFDNVTTGTLNVATAGASIINLGGTGSTVNIKELTLTTDLEVQYGGTGRSTFTENGVIYGNTTDGLLVTAESNPGSNATTSFGILTTDINNVPVWTDVIDGGSY
jgi:hypothetical protein